MPVIGVGAILSPPFIRAVGWPQVKELVGCGGARNGILSPGKAWITR